MTDKEKADLIRAARLAMASTDGWSDFWKEYEEHAAKHEARQKEVVKPRHEDTN